MSFFGFKFKLLFAVFRWWFVLLRLRVTESLGGVQGPGNWKVVSVKKKDRSFAAVESGFNSRLTHNRLIPDRSAAAT